ncbi:MAG: hypothetical protein WBL63_15640 [Candidatus Acidiferrum sp.]
MNLTNLVLAAILVLVIGAVVFGLAMAFRTFLRYRGQRLVTCPETHKPAAVHVNVAKAAGKKLWGKEEIRLDQCSRWPEKRNCGQDCLSELRADPENCLVWNMVAMWYRGKSCAYCQKPFEGIQWHNRHPALLSPEREAKQWNEIPPEQLPEVFQTHLPVCWNCYIAETFRRKNAGRVLDRNWERGVGGEYIPKNGVEPPPQKRTSIH